MAFLHPANGYDPIRYAGPRNITEARLSGRVEFTDEDGTLHKGENTTETPQVHFLLDLLCRITHRYTEVEDGGAWWTHEDVKVEMTKAMPTLVWWSNRNSADGQLRQIQDGVHWLPHAEDNAKLCLRFRDTDGNDWSAIAENLIDMCRAGRVWIHGDGDFEDEGDGRFEYNEQGDRRIRYLTKRRGYRSLLQ